MSFTSVIIPEHKESDYIVSMLDQIEAYVPAPKEVIVVTSASSLSIPTQRYDFRCKVVTDVHGSGIARNEGVSIANGDILMFMDCHTCLSDLSSLLSLLRKNPGAVIAPGIQPHTFPECQSEGGVGYGCYFTYSFGWKWIGKERNTSFEVPFASACFLLMNKQTFFDSVIGFIPVEGVGFEEELCMRLHRLDHPTIIDVNTVIGHLFKKRYPSESTKGYVPSRAVALVLSVHEEELFNEINSLNEKQWGDSWRDAVSGALNKYGTLRRVLNRKQVKKVDERWFFRV